MKHILITGARGGIGLETAILLARRGHHVIATVHREESVATVLQRAKQEKVKLESWKLDITSAEDRARLKMMDIDVLINNAGFGESGPIAEIPLERVKHNHEVNVLGTLSMIQSVIPSMIRHHRGRIINISSVVGRFTTPFMAAYCMTKYAIESMSDALRMELKEKGIDVVVIEPGRIGTGFNERMSATKYAWMNERSLFADKLKILRHHDRHVGDHAAHPIVVAKTIVSAVEARKPQSHYVVPKSYRNLTGLACVLPTWYKDKILSDRYVR